MTDQKNGQTDKSRAALGQRVNEGRAVAGEEGMLPCSMNIPYHEEDPDDEGIDPDMVGAVDPDQPRRVATARRIHDQRRAHRSIVEQQEGADAIAEQHREGRRASKNRYDDIDD